MSTTQVLLLQGPGGVSKPKLEPSTFMSAHDPHDTTAPGYICSSLFPQKFESADLTGYHYPPEAFPR